MNAKSIGVCATVSLFAVGCLTTMTPTEIETKRREAQYLHLKAEVARRAALETRDNASALETSAEEVWKKRDDLLFRAKKSRQARDPDERGKARYFEENAHRLERQARSLRRAARETRGLASAKELEASQLQSKGDRLAKRVQVMTEKLRRQGIRTSDDIPK